MWLTFVSMPCLLLVFWQPWLAVVILAIAFTRDWFYSDGGF